MITKEEEKFLQDLQETQVKTLDFLVEFLLHMSELKNKGNFYDRERYYDEDSKEIYNEFKGIMPIKLDYDRLYEQEGIIFDFKDC